MCESSSDNLLGLPLAPGFEVSESEKGFDQLVEVDKLSFLREACKHHIYLAVVRKES